MTAHDKTGGSAFPMPANEYAGHGPEWGMTLRDYFAAKAMAAALGSLEYSVHCRDTLAQDAYLIADAMLAARNEEI